MKNDYLCPHCRGHLRVQEYIDFFCPICHGNLAAKDITNNLARIIMVEEKKRKKGEIPLFARPPFV